MIFRSLGIKRPAVPPEDAARIPPGNYVTQRWPVLHAGSIPPFNAATWDLTTFGLVDHPLTLSYADVLALPRVQVTSDFHCVTRWSTLDNHWEGVSFRELLRRTKPTDEARYVTFHCDGSYTANLPLSVLDNDDVLLAFARNGEPLTPEHGYPLRAIVPKRYAWKSAKWLRGIEFMAHDRAGFWERYGYHNNADPWREERFAE